MNGIKCPARVIRWADVAAVNWRGARGCFGRRAEAPLGQISRYCCGRISTLEASIGAAARNLPPHPLPPLRRPVTSLKIMSQYQNQSFL